jgi:Arc/MetJ-type ribon-helix-helix transcriptional regulator
MAVVLSPETEKLIEQRLAETGIGSADELVRIAMQFFDATRGEDIEDLDEETQAALDEASAQLDRGERIPIEDVRKELESEMD